MGAAQRGRHPRARGHRGNGNPRLPRSSNRLARWSALAALALLLAAFPGAFYFWVAPANDFFLNTMPGILPQKWMAMRDSWETGHAVRFALQLAALALLVVPLAREASAGKS